MTLRSRLSLLLVLVVVVPLVLGSVVALTVLSQAQARGSEGQLFTTANSVAAVLEQTCTRVQAAATALGQDAAGGGTQAAAQRLVDERLAAYAVVTDAAGAITAAAGSLPPAALPPRTATGYDTCRTGEGPPYAAAASVDMTAEGRVVGRAAAALPLDGSFARRLEQVSETGLTFGAAGAVLGSTLPPEQARGLVAAASSSSDRPERVGGLLVLTRPPGPGSPTWFAVSVPAPTLREEAATAVAIVVIAAGVAVVLARQLARQTTQPLVELGDAAARVAGGDLRRHMPVHSSDDEVGRLAGAFNAMTDELRETITELQHSRDELRRNLTRLGETLASTHDFNRILTVILETAMASVRAVGGAVFMEAAGRDELYLKVSRGYAADELPPETRLRFGQGVTGCAAARGEPLVMTAGDPRSPERAPGDPPAERGLVAVPLKSSGRVIGVLTLADREDGRPFDEGDRATLATFAAQATVAVDNVLLHQEAQRLSITDGLTGLWNYRYFTMNLGKEIERATRFARPLALLMLDLDRFKLVNDSHGHQRGDAVLVEFATRVRAEIREVDTLARYGGEELVLVLPETDLSGAEQLAQRIGDVVRRRAFGHDGEVPLPVTVSIGVAVFPAHGTTAAALLRTADEALYQAKHAGRDRYALAPLPAPVVGPAAVPGPAVAPGSGAALRLLAGGGRRPGTPS